MKSLLLSAAVLIAVVGVAHSYLGERFILMRLFKREDLPQLFGSADFTMRTLRFAWHLTTVAWFGFAALLYQLAEGSVSSHSVAMVIAVTALVSFVVAFVGSRGRHLAWIAFLAIGGVALYATTAHGGEPQPALQQVADEGGPVYPEDKDVGGGARDAPWSAPIADSKEPGERLVLSGTVYDHEGKPRAGVTVYAYHTDARGYYRSKPWGRPRLRGWARTDAQGRYEFHTIKPGPYPMQRNPAHIHMSIAIPQQVEWWIPELRFAGDPLLSAEDAAREAQRGAFASIRPLERQADGTLRCVRDIRVPRAW